MPGTPTPVLGLAVPTIGGDLGPQWAAELNGDLAILDNLGAIQFFTFVTSGVITPGIFPETVALGYGGAAGISLNLPLALQTNRIIVVKKMDATPGFVTVNALVGTIDGSPTYVLTNQYQYVRVFWDGQFWDIIGGN